MKVSRFSHCSIGIAFAASALCGGSAESQALIVRRDSSALVQTVRAVSALDSTLTAAEARGDTAAMRPFFAAAYYSVAPDGEMLGTGARLFRIARGAKATDSTQNLTAPWVRALGSDAVLVTRSIRIWGQRHRTDVTGSTFRVTRLYIREDGRWRVLFQQGTPLADEHIARTGPGSPPHYAPH